MNYSSVGTDATGDEDWLIEVPSEPHVPERVHQLFIIEDNVFSPEVPEPTDDPLSIKEEKDIGKREPADMEYEKEEKIVPITFQKFEGSFSAKDIEEHCFLGSQKTERDIVKWEASDLEYQKKEKIEPITFQKFEGSFSAKDIEEHCLLGLQQTETDPSEPHVPEGVHQLFIAEDNVISPEVPEPTDDPLSIKEEKDIVKREPTDMEYKKEEKIVPITFQIFEGSFSAKDIDEHCLLGSQKTEKIMIPEVPESIDDPLFTKEEMIMIPEVPESIVDPLFTKEEMIMIPEVPESMDDPLFTKEEMDIVKLEIADNKYQSKETVVSITFPKLEGDVIVKKFEEFYRSEQTEEVHTFGVEENVPRSLNMDAYETGVSENAIHLSAEPFEEGDTVPSLHHETVKQNMSEVHSESFNERHIRSSASFGGNALSPTSAVVTHRRTYTCHECGKVFFIKRCMRRHAKRHMNALIYEAVESGKTLRETANPRIHDRRHTERLAYKCVECDKSFGSKTQLTTHSRNHTRERPYRCFHCGKTFISKTTLANHYRVHSDERQFRCDKCGKSFRHRRNMEAHLKVHSSERPYVCNQCGNSYKHKFHLKFHSAIHSGERPYRCEHCGKSFRRIGHLINHSTVHSKEKPLNHSTVHSKEKPFRCDECGKQFMNKRDIVSHATVHTGVPSYSCNECKKRFTYKRSLIRHSKIHHEDKVFRCNDCSKTYILRAEIEEHVRIHM